MSLLRKIIVLLSFLAFQTTVLFAQEKPAAGEAELKAVEGIWLTKEGKSRIKIQPCDDSLCNEIIWLRSPNDKNGNPQADVLNQNEKLRGRPVLGIAILLKMKRIRDNIWQGWIYDPEKGKAFQGHARLITADKMEIKGCHDFLPICKTHIWKKVGEAPAN